MMRWNYTAAHATDADSSEPTSPVDGRPVEVSPAQYLHAAIASFFAVLGTRSAVVAVMVALVVAAVLLGLSAEEASATMQFCRKC